MDDQRDVDREAGLRIRHAIRITLYRRTERIADDDAEAYLAGARDLVRDAFRLVFDDELRRDQEFRRNR
jgi:hypothetical protein